jgi:hypothetical protein
LRPVHRHEARGPVLFHAVLLAAHSVGRRELAQPDVDAVLLRAVAERLRGARLRSSVDDRGLDVVASKESEKVVERHELAGPSQDAPFAFDRRDAHVEHAPDVDPCGDDARLVVVAADGVEDRSGRRGEHELDREPRVGHLERDAEVAPVERLDAERALLRVLPFVHQGAKRLREHLETGHGVRPGATRMLRDPSRTGPDTVEREVAPTADWPDVSAARVIRPFCVSRFVLPGRHLAHDVDLPLEVLTLSAVVAPEVPATPVPLVVGA